MTVENSIKNALESRRKDQDTIFGPDAFGRAHGDMAGKVPSTKSAKKAIRPRAYRTQVSFSKEINDELLAISASLTVPPSVVARILIGEALAARKAKKTKASE